MRSHGMSRSRPRRVGTRHEGDSPGHGDCRSSFLEPPGRSFLCARDQKPEKARGSCRSRGRQERAHRSLENRQPGFPQLPPALSSFSGNRKKCHPCSRLTLLPMFPVAPALCIFESNSTTFTECHPRLGNATHKLRMMLKAVVEPVLFGTKPDQHACGTAVASDHDFLLFRQAEVLRQIVLDFSESYRLELACLLRRARLALRPSR